MDAEQLHLTELLFSADQLSQLAKNPIFVKNMKDVKHIHRFLFQDIYDWAGEYRQVNINKEGKPFMSFQSFAQGDVFLNQLIETFLSSTTNIEDASVKLAKILYSLNYMHPFREGNGRVEREVLRCLALSQGFILRLNPADKKQVYDEYMQGTIQGDLQILKNVIEKTWC